MHRICAPVLLLALLVPASAAAYGEGSDDRPSIEERAIHFYTDEVRLDPDHFDDEFSGYSPMHPLIYNRDLNDAARFYAEDMEANGCFPADHSSCDGTPFDARVWSFYSGSTIGENIAMGQAEPEATVWESWLYSDGHRDNMLRVDFEELGSGFAGAVNTGESWYVQDFGARGGLSIPEVTSATHAPLYPSVGSSVRFEAAIWDELDQPAHVQLQVEDVCHEMAVDRIKDNGPDQPVTAWTFGVTVVAGAESCTPWLIVVTRVDGSTAVYPDTGSLLMPVGGAQCVAWTEDEAPSQCNPQPKDGLGGSGTGCSSGDGTPGANVGSNAEYGSCSVARSPRRLGALLLTLGAVALRRRRR